MTLDATLNILLSSVLIGLIVFIGVFTLSLKEELSRRIIHTPVSLSADSLIWSEKAVFGD